MADRILVEVVHLDLDGRVRRRVDPLTNTRPRDGVGQPFGVSVPERRMMFELVPLADSRVEIGREHVPEA